MTQKHISEPADASAPPPQVSIISHAYFPYLPGGAERQALCIAESLAARGWRMQVLTKHISGTPKRELLNGVEVRRLFAPTVPKTQSALLTLGFLYHLLTGPRGQVIHLNRMYREIVPALIARRLRGSPIVICLHLAGNTQFADIKQLLRKPGGKLMLRLSRRADCLVSLNQQMTQEMLEHGFARERIIEIPNAVDTRRFTPVSAEEKARLRRELDLPPDGPLVIFVGRLHYQKGLETLIRAWKTVCQSQPQAHLLLVGQGPDQEKLEQLAADLEVGASLHFLGQREPVLPYLQAADVFVLPSLFEAISIALLEAMACGMAVVTTNIDGTREIVRPEVDGLLVEPGDAPQLSAALGRVLGDAALAARLGSAARQRVEALYSLEQYIARFAALYTRLAGTPQGAQGRFDAAPTGADEAQHAASGGRA